MVKSANMQASFIKRMFSLAAVVVLAALLLTTSSLLPPELSDRVRAYTRGKEFNFVSWVGNALGVKIAHASLGTERYLTTEERHALVLDYLRLVQSTQEAEARLNDIYADPNVADPESATASVRAELEQLRRQKGQLSPLAEGVLQSQINQVAAELGLAMGGQTIPPVLYHSTPLPWALIVSPRDVIRQDADINLKPEFTLEEHAALEAQVDQNLDVSSLVVRIGGVGVYPTMVSQTSNLNWLSEVVAHEWVHNFLTLRPLGMSYLGSPELRIMNETTASIAGKEIGRAVLEKYYPEFLPVEPPPPSSAPAPESEPPAFDFIKEMRETRVTTDRLLAEGKVTEAEAYMEMRRRVFWENGYRIRKLNQAYFAFHGAYADDPRGGAAGEDPVGAAVRKLRSQSASLEEFLKRIAWMSSFEQLKQAVGS